MPEGEPEAFRPEARLSDETESAAEAVERRIAALHFHHDGLLPAIIQDDESNAVLMLAWMDAEAVRRTLTSGRVTFWSRSRQEYWRKGDTSGHRQYVRSVQTDCDEDTLLVRVVQVGAACHTGTRTCFDGRGIAAVRGDLSQGGNSSESGDSSEGDFENGSLGS